MNALYSPSIEPNIRPSLVNNHSKSDFDLWHYGNVCFALRASHRAKYILWLDFFERNKKTLDGDYSKFIRALNFLMDGDYAITRLDQAAFKKGTVFLEQIFLIKSSVEDDSAAQALLQLAYLLDYDKSKNSLSLPNTLNTHQKITLRDCVDFYRSRFDPHFQLPSFIDFTKSVTSEEHKHFVAILFEQGDLREYLKKLRLSRKEAHLLKNIDFTLLGHGLTIAHYILAARLVKYHPQHLALAFQILDLSETYRENIVGFKKDLSFTI